MPALPPVTRATLGAEPSARNLLMDAAEKLVAEQGRQAASSRAIIQAAGQRHNSAITYYFGTRDDLFQSVWVRGGAIVNAKRQQLIDRHGDASWTMPDLVNVYLTPLADYLDSRTPSYWARFNDEALRDYPLRIIPRMRQQMSEHPDPQPLDVLRRLFLRMQDLLGPDAYPDSALRISTMARGVFSTYAAWERDAQQGRTDFTAKELAQPLHVTALAILDSGQ